MNSVVMEVLCLKVRWVKGLSSSIANQLDQDCTRVKQDSLIIHSSIGESMIDLFLFMVQGEREKKRAKS